MSKRQVDLSILDQAPEKKKVDLSVLDGPAMAAQVRAKQNTPINRQQAAQFPSMQERGITQPEEDTTSWSRLYSPSGLWNAIKTGVGDLINKPTIKDVPDIVHAVTNTDGGPAGAALGMVGKMWNEYGPGHLENLDKITLKDVLHAVTPGKPGTQADDRNSEDWAKGDKVYLKPSPGLARGEKAAGKAWNEGAYGTAITRQILNTIPILGPMAGDFADNPDPSAFAGHVLGAVGGAAFGETAEGSAIPEAIESGLAKVHEVPSIALRGGKAVLSPVKTTKAGLGAIGDIIRPIKAAGIDKINEAAGVTPDNSLTMALRPKNTSLDFTRQAPIARALIAQSAEEIGRPVIDIEAMDVAKEHAISKLVDKQEELMEGNVRSHDGTPIATAIKDAVPELYRHENPEAASAIDEWADTTYGQPLTDRQLNTFRKDANAEVSGFNGKLPNQQMALSRTLDSAIKVAKTDAIRKLQIDSMNEFNGTGKGMQQVNGGLRALLTVGDALDRRFNVVQRQALQNLPQQVSKMLAAGKFGKAALSLMRGDILGAGMDTLSGMGQVGLTDFMKEVNSANGQIASAFRRTTEKPLPIDMGLKAPAAQAAPAVPEVTPRQAGINRLGLQAYLENGELVKNPDGTYGLAPQGMVEKDPATGRFRQKAAPATGLGLPDRPLTTNDLPQPGGEVSIERHPVTGQFQRKVGGMRYTDEAVRSQLGLTKPLSTYVADGTLTKNFDGTYSVPEKSVAPLKPLVERDTATGRFRRVTQETLTTNDLPKPDGQITVERDPSTGRFRRKDTGALSVEGGMQSGEGRSKIVNMLSDFLNMDKTGSGGSDAGMARMSRFNDGKFTSKLGTDIEEKSPPSALAKHFMNIAEQSGGTESKSLKAWLEGFNGEKVSREDVMDQVKKSTPDIKEHWLGSGETKISTEDQHDFEAWLEHEQDIKVREYNNMPQRQQNTLHNAFHEWHGTAAHVNEDVQAPMDFVDWLAREYDFPPETALDDLSELPRHEQDSIDDQYAEYTRRQVALHNNSAPTKFEDYTLPGGSNYREYVATLPGDKSEPLGFEAWLKKEYPGTSKDNFAALKETVQDDLKLKYKRQLKGGYLDPQAYNVPDGHAYNDRDLDVNRLLHARVKDRVTADGAKTLFVEELQSDWHQTGRKQGYNSGEPLRKLEDLSREELLDILQKNDQNGSYTDAQREDGDAPMTKAEALEHFKQMQEDDPNFDVSRYLRNEFYADGVPDAPFKKDWHELGMKRMLQEAVDNNYDSLSWTTGEQQADRYSLAKHVDELNYNPETNELQGYKGSNLVFKKTVPANELSGYVGQDVAKKLEQAKVGVKYADYRSISGQDLKVGGEGMKGFYDKMLPNFMDKYLKKYGVKAEKVRISTSDKGASFVEEYGHPDSWIIKKNTEPGYVTPYDVIGRNGTKLVDIFRTKEAAQQFIDASKAAHIEQLSKNQPEVWSVKITPEMRRDLAKGQPLTGNLTLRDLPKGGKTLPKDAGVMKVEGNKYDFTISPTKENGRYVILNNGLPTNLARTETLEEANRTLEWAKKNFANSESIKSHAKPVVNTTTTTLDDMVKKKVGKFIEPMTFSEILGDRPGTNAFIGHDGRLMDLNAKNNHAQAIAKITGDDEFADKAPGNDAFMEEALADHDLIRVVFSHYDKTNEINLHFGKKPSQRALNTIKKLIKENPEADYVYDMGGADEYVSGSGNSRKFLQDLGKTYK